MSKRKLAALLLGSGLVPLASHPAAAVDYIFTVTVDARSLHPSVTLGRVACALFDARGTAVAVVSPGTANFTLMAGSYAGSIEIRMSTALGAVAAASWQCFLSFNIGGGDYRLAAALSDPAHPQFREEYRRAPGSVFRGTVEGRF